MKKEQLKELLNDLSLKEKLGQLIQLTGSFYQDDSALVTGPKENLGIDDEIVQLAGSLLNVRGAKITKKIQKKHLEKSRIPMLFMGDVINGFETIFPVPIGLGSMWNPELIQKIAEISAHEASVSGQHVTYSPMVDLVRDPRWGRVMESTGEDVYLNSTYAKAFVHGYQGEGDTISDHSIAACVKHFAAYGAPEGGREYNTVDMSERKLREYYLPAYKAALDSGARMVMTSFNTVDGIPATGNAWLNRDILREEWGFDGILISDFAAIKELIEHGVAKDNKDAARMALEAGVDIDMMTSVYTNHLEEAIKDKPELRDMLDESVYRVLELKNELGLFENPYRSASEEEEKKVLLSEEYRDVARTAVTESLVLLKNDNILPLNPTKKVALIGPYGDSTSLSGSWSFSSDKEATVTLKEAFTEYVGQENLLVATGTKVVETAFLKESLGNYYSEDDDMIINEEEAYDKALKYASEAEIVVVAVGEHYLQSGEGGSRGDITLPEGQKKLIQALTELGKPMIAVIFSGRPLDLTKEVQQFDGILQAWFPGTEAGRGIADVVFGNSNPSGRLSMSFPYTVGQVPVYYNEYATGRPLADSSHSLRYTSKYVDIPNKPLFPFGFGLSYSHFDYSPVSLSTALLTKGGKISATVEVTNQGSMAGKETIQLYIRDKIGSVTRPVKELKGFKQVTLEPQETKTITFDITEDMLRFYTKDMTYTTEAGEFEVMIGRNCEDVQKTTFDFVE